MLRSIISYEYDIENSMRENILSEMRGNIKHSDFIEYKLRSSNLIDFKYFSPFYNKENYNLLKFFVITYEVELESMIEEQLLLNNITFINIKNITDKFFYKMLAKNINLFKCLNSEHITDNIIKVAIANDYLMIDFVEKITEELCKIAIKSNIKAIYYVPINYYDIYLSVINDVESFKYMRQNAITSEMALLGVKNAIFYDSVPELILITNSINKDDAKNEINNATNNEINNATNNEINNETNNIDIITGDEMIKFEKENENIISDTKIIRSNLFRILQFIPSKLFTNEIFDLIINENGYFIKW